MRKNMLPVDPELSFLVTALEQSIIAIILIDDNDCVLFFNRAAETLWGYSRGDVLGQNVSKLVPEELRLQHRTFIRLNREGGWPRVMGMNRELQLERSDGRLVWTSFALSKACVNDKVYYLAMARDVTAEVAQSEQNALLLQAISHTSQPLIVLSPDLRVVQANSAFADMSGYNIGDLTGKCPEQLLFFSDVTAESIRFQSLLRDRRSMTDDFLIVNRLNVKRWVRISVSVVWGGHDQSGHRILTFTDFTEDQQIRGVEKAVLTAVSNKLSFGECGRMICRQAEAVLPDVRVTLYQVYQGEMQEWATGDIPVPDRNNPREYHLSRDIGQGDDAVTGKLVMIFPSVARATPFAERVAESCIHFGSLVLEQELSRQQIDHLTQFDSLTGLPLRNKLHQYFDQWLNAPTSSRLAVFCLSIDNFGLINDIAGYAVADSILQKLAERLKQIMQPGQFLSRIEGIQFALLAPGYGEVDASAFAADLRKSLPELVTLEKHAFHLTVSTGISLWPDGDRDSLLAAARYAMEQIRDNGGDGWQFFSPEANHRMKEDLMMGLALKQAIAEDRLKLHYQPQVYADSGELYGVEALSRWSDPQFGQIPPQRFISIADRMGETGNLGYWVLKEACRQSAEWRQLGIGIPVVSVNLSPKNFQDPGLPSYIAALLKEHSIPGDSLTVEITESDMMEINDSMKAGLDEIRALGVGLSVDDFGTGFSGLSSLARLPVTEIKIDKSFIDDVLSNRRTRALTEAMISIGHSLDLTIVAEGVETQEQLMLLRENYCTAIQGYLFSCPLSPQQLSEWIRLRGNGIK